VHEPPPGAIDLVPDPVAADALALLRGPEDGDPGAVLQAADDVADDTFEAPG